MISRHVYAILACLIGAIGFSRAWIDITWEVDTNHQVDTGQEACEKTDTSEDVSKETVVHANAMF